MKQLKIFVAVLALGISIVLQAQAEHTYIVAADTLEADTIATIDTLADGPAALPWPMGAQASIDKLLENDMFETSQLGLAVYDLTADSAIYMHNERQLMRPASIMKMVTAIAALDKLGGDYQFKTDLYYTGTVADSTLTGDVYCVGGFDPKLGRDDLRAFVVCIRGLGIDTIRGTMFADKSMKDLNTLGSGWCWDDDNPVLSPLVFRRGDHFMDEFVKQLRALGVQVEAFNAVGRRPANAKRLCRRTHTIDEVLLPMMKKSDNLYAEALFYQLAATDNGHTVTAKDAAAAVKRLLGKAGMEPGRYRIADGSGLSLYNYVSVEMMVKLMRYAYRHDEIYRHLLPSLPVGGVDGTLSSRLRGKYTRGKVWAKTGTLTGISSLAGYCEAPNGHLLAFAIINQGVMHGKNGRAFQDQVLKALCMP